MIRINLALQGGGAHGAFTWGVLEALLGDEGIEIAAISGTSAGALNGAALKAGLAQGGREGAKASLARLWDEVASLNEVAMLEWMKPFLPIAAAWADAAEAVFPVSPAGVAAQFFTPYSMGRMWTNPLEGIVRRLDFSKVCADDGPVLFVGATNVRNGRVKVFSGSEITPEALMASTCLPTLFQAVEIVDPATGVTEAYWDGGYVANPPLHPLYHPALPDDIVIVSVNPLRRETVPRTPIAIQDRINEISFNASILSDLRAVAFVRRLIADGRMPKGAMKEVLIHRIADDILMEALDGLTKLTPMASFLERLRVAGQVAGAQFLTDHRADLNQRGTVDLGGLYA